MALAIASVIFAVFVVNVFLGATSGTLFFTDVQKRKHRQGDFSAHFRRWRKAS